MAALLGTAIGLTIGVVSGFLAGWVDIVGMRVVDLFFAIPTLLVAIGIVALFGAVRDDHHPRARDRVRPLLRAPHPRLGRGTRSRPYVDASRVLGSAAGLLRNDILPGVAPIALVQSTALLGYALVDEAALGFLGLGVQPPDASWGQMINAGRQFIFSAPWLTIMPGLVVIIAVFAINLTGDGLRDVLDPRSSQRVQERA